MCKSQSKQFFKNKFIRKQNKTEKDNPLFKVCYGSLTPCPPFLQKQDKVASKLSTKLLSDFNIPPLDNSGGAASHMDMSSSNNNNNMITNTNNTTSMNNILPHGNTNMNSESTRKDEKGKYEKMKLPERDITDYEEQKIKEVFRSIFLFDIIPEELIDIILSSLFLVKVCKGDIICQQDTPNEYFYIVVEGEFIEENDANENKPLKVYKPWDCFGHTSLMSPNQNEPMRNTVKCTKNAELFLLNGETFTSIKDKIIHHLCEERYAFLDTISFFKSLDSITKHTLVNKMILITYDAGEVIITKGSKDRSIFLIKSGSVSVLYKDKECKVLGPNSYVGIISVFTKSKRTLDVVTKERTVVFELSSEDLHETIGENYLEILLFSIFKEYVNMNTTLNELIKETNVNNVFKQFKLKSYMKNECITTYNKNLKRVVFILEGSFVHASSMEQQYKAGSILGEETLTSNIDIPSDLKAYPDCMTLEANLNDISDLLGEEFRATTINLLTKVLKMQKIKFFNLSPETTLKRLSNYITKEKFNANQKIIEQGSALLDKVYLLSKGNVRIIINKKPVRELEKYALFGEYALMNNIQYRTATVVALSSVTCYVVKKDDFIELIKDKNIYSYMMYLLSLRDNSIQINELKYMSTLGKGKFGTVSLVHNKKNVYAIKVVSKKDANVRKRFAQYLQTERKVLLCLDHPFVVKMIKSFKNAFCVYFLLEYVNGVSLRDLIFLNRKVFNTNDIKFYIASLCLVLDYIHKKKICHRDIKPANIMVDSNGYIKLIDFGTSIIMKNYTNTIIGTPSYIAPEVLNGKGYSFSCDYWSVGVCMFELFYKKLPFGTECSEIMEVYNDIMYSEYKFPFVNEMFKSLNELISMLLQKQVGKRVCSLSKIKKMEIFDGFLWENLIEMKMNVPVLPEVFDVGRYKLENYNVGYENEIMRIGDIDIGFVNKYNGKGEEWDVDF